MKVLTSAHIAMERYRKYIVLAGTLIINSTICVTFILGNITTYIYSVKFSKSDGFESTDIDPSWMTSSYLFFRLFGTLCVDYSRRKIGLRATLAIGSFLSISSVYLTYFTSSHSILATTATLILIGSIGNSITVMSNMIFATLWFEKNAGVAIALVNGATGVGGVISNQMITRYINPRNLVPDAKYGHISYFSQPEIAENVPGLFLLLGTYTACLQIGGFFLIREPPTESEESNNLISEPCDSGNNENDGTNPTTTKGAIEESFSSFTRSGRLNLSLGKHSSDKISENHPLPGSINTGTSAGHHPRRVTSNKNGSSEYASWLPSEVVRSLDFWILELAVMALTCGFVLVINNYKLFGQLFIKDDRFFAIIGSTLSVFVIGSYLLCGYMIDTIGVKNTLVTHLTCSSMALSLWYFIPAINEWVYMIYVVFISCVHYNMFVLLPTICLRLYGKRFYSTNFAIGQVTSLLALIVAPIIISALLDATGWFWVMFSFALLSFLVLLTVVSKMSSKRK